MADDSPGDLLNRLHRERLDADRRYNEALTRLDRALPVAPTLPDSPPPYDDRLVSSINERWDILPSGQPAGGSGLRGRLASFVWRIVGPALEQQRSFNAAAVDHLNRNVDGARQISHAVAHLLRALRDQAAVRATFDSLLLQFLQQITGFVETKDRELDGAIGELRTIAELSQRSAVMAQREIERLAAGTVAASVEGTGAPDRPTVGDAVKYVGFEDLFRGSQAEVRARVADYVPAFTGTANVLDVGCGRGEFLQLLKEAGVQARGLDTNHEMVEVCRAHGLEAVEADALTYLTGLPDESLGGLFAAQVVEHFEPDYLARFLGTAYHKLQPGGPIVLETVNAACWVAFFESYLRDLTHVRALHPETLRFLLLANGFARIELVFRSPVPESGRLQRLEEPPVPPGTPDDAPVRQLVAWARTFNSNVDRLNERMFTHLDYAAIAVRP